VLSSHRITESLGHEREHHATCLERLSAGGRIGQGVVVPPLTTREYS